MEIEPARLPHANYLRSCLAPEQPRFGLLFPHADHRAYDSRNLKTAVDGAI